ncbi:MAG: DUF1194 domain-containing protein [Paracoccaceae bacterium]
MRNFLILMIVVIPMPLKACGLALLLAVDVSGSVDRDEYSIQMIGLADALRDGIVADALVSQQASVSLLQWTGATRQKQSIPWTSINTHSDVTLLADRIEAEPRAWRNFSTAIGEALEASLAALTPMAHCGRKVVDVSGDGISNEGVEPDVIRNRLNQAGVTVNAIAIETDDADLTGYFFEHVITGEGAFVFQAVGFEDYPEKIRKKLRKETTERTSSLINGSP